MKKALACVNLKGGVGKTTIAVNFAAYCGINSIKTLIVDIDPQTNATISCIGLEKWEKLSEENGTIANLLGVRTFTSAEGKKIDAKSVIIKEVFKNVDLIPSHFDLYSMDLDLAGATAREHKLRNAIKEMVNDYDLIICDCPPNLTIATQNALAFCTHYIIPVSPDFLSGIGVGLLQSRIDEFCEDVGNKLELAGIIISRYGRKALFREQTIGALKSQFGALVLDNHITDRVKISEAPALMKSIFEMDDVDAIREFNEMSKEILRRMHYENS